MDRMIENFLRRKPEKLPAVYRESEQQPEAEHPEITIETKIKNLKGIAPVMKYASERATESLSQLAAAARMQREAIDLEMVSGLSVKQVTEFFLAGYTMRPPEPAGKLEDTFAELEAERILNGHGTEYEQHIMKRFMREE